MFKDENLILKPDTIECINKDNLKQILINLKLKLDCSDGIKSLMIRKSDLAAVLNQNDRYETLFEVQDYMLKTAGINYKCYNCSYVEGCSLTPGKVDNCKDVMAGNIERWK